MRTWKRPSQGISPAWLWLILAAMLLSACVAPPGGSSRTGVDLVTDSDEPELRKRAKVRLELAVGYFGQGQTTVALDEVKQALVLDPTFAEAFNLRGLVYMRLNDMGLAEDSFKRSLVLSPRNPDVSHNYGWMLCQMGRYNESDQMFQQTMASPSYTHRAKTLMAHGLCQMRAGKPGEAEQSLSRAIELDPGNPVIGYNLSQLLFKRGELGRAQFYIRRINNSELANAETFWLGIKVERGIQNLEAMGQLGDQLRRRFPQSRELAAYERGAFDE